MTTPPCAEGVRSIVMHEEVSVSSQQVDRFLGILGANARPPRPLNGRTIGEFRRE